MTSVIETIDETPATSDIYLQPREIRGRVMYAKVFFLCLVLAVSPTLGCGRASSLGHVCDDAPPSESKEWMGSRASAELPSNGWHPVVHPRYSEMWYFDFQAITGDVIVSSFTIYGNLEENATVGICVRLDIYRKSGETFHGTSFVNFYQILDFSASLEKLDVGVGFCYAREVDSSIEIYLTNGTISCFLKYTQEASPWVKPKRVERDLYSTWFVPFPRASVAGWYDISGELHPVSGIGYHDHTWELTPKVITESGVHLGYPLLWGRIYTKDLTVLITKVPGGYQVACVFFDGEVVELSSFRFAAKNGSLLISSLSKDAMLEMQVEIEYSAQLFSTERLEAYRHLVLAKGVFLSKSKSAVFIGSGIMQIHSVICSNEAIHE